MWYRFRNEPSTIWYANRTVPSFQASWHRLARRLEFGYEMLKDFLILIGLPVLVCTVSCGECVIHLQHVYIELNKFYSFEYQQVLCRIVLVKSQTV